MKKISGFTLIELLVVIAIISILTAIVTANFTSSKAKARDAERISDIAQIQLALSLFFDKCNAYPAVLARDAGTVGGNCLRSDGTNVQLIDYISVIPNDPRSRAVYTYKTNINIPLIFIATDYVLRAKLETNSSVLNDDVDDIPSNVAPLGISGGCGAVGDPIKSDGYYYCVKPN